MYTVKCQEKISAYFHTIKIVQRKLLFSISNFYGIFHDTKNKNWLKDTKFMIIDTIYVLWILQVSCTVHSLFIDI